MEVRKILICFLIQSTVIASYAQQQITKDRIDILRKTVVNVYVDDGSSSGTGFFISSNGNVLTCWHVIKSAIRTDSSGHVIGFKKVFIKTEDNKRHEVGIPLIFVTNKTINEVAVAYDFCLLTQVEGRKDFPFLHFGDFNNISEGDDIYTCGYPLGLKYQFVSRGILSTKVSDTVLLYDKGIQIGKRIRNVALLDLTINKGNSGGPIIKMGKTYKDDVVIGIANFNINPFGQTAENLNTELQRETNVILPNGVSLTQSMILFSKAIINSSNGISGCVSINHFLLSIGLF